MPDKIEWSRQEMDITTLNPHPDNPRYITKKDFFNLIGSIDKFGLCEPIIINTDNTIIGGHQRVKALLKMGIDFAEVNVPNRTLDECEVRELMIRLNRNQGNWDDEILANIFSIEELLAYGFLESDLEMNNQSEEKEEESKKYIITITLENEDDFKAVEDKVSNALDKVPGAKYKTKIK